MARILAAEIERLEKEVSVERLVVNGGQEAHRLGQRLRHEHVIEWIAAAIATPEDLLALP